MIWRVVHMLALFWMMAGLGAVMTAVYRAWRVPDIEAKTMLIAEAERNERTWLLPGVIATGVTGFAWGAASDWNPVATGWLVALELLFAIDAFIFVPLMGVGLRRVHYLALQARKQNEVTPELQDALADNVPIVFGTLVILTIPVMTWLPVFKPF